MSRTAFFLTPYQRDDASGRVAQNPLELGSSSKTGEAVERAEAGLGLHRPRSYWLQPKRDKFSKSLYR